MFSYEVKFVNPSYTQKITQSFTITLDHPCKATQITTSQVIAPISFRFGDPPLQQSFSHFSDTVSAQYGIQPPICHLKYNVAPSTLAASYGVTIGYVTGTLNSVVYDQSVYIQVKTVDPALLGQTAVFTLSSYNDPVLQVTPSSTLTFYVTVVNTCPDATLSFIGTLSALNAVAMQGVAS